MRNLLIGMTIAQLTALVVITGEHYIITGLVKLMTSALYTALAPLTQLTGL